MNSLMQPTLLLQRLQVLEDSNHASKLVVRLLLLAGLLEPTARPGANPRCSFTFALSLTQLRCSFCVASCVLSESFPPCSVWLSLHCAIHFKLTLLNSTFLQPTMSHTGQENPPLHPSCLPLAVPTAALEPTTPTTPTTGTTPTTTHQLLDPRSTVGHLTHCGRAISQAISRPVQGSVCQQQQPMCCICWHQQLSHRTMPLWLIWRVFHV